MSKISIKLPLIYIWLQPYTSSIFFLSNQLARGSLRQEFGTLSRLDRFRDVALQTFDDSRRRDRWNCPTPIGRCFLEIERSAGHLDYVPPTQRDESSANPRRSPEKRICQPSNKIYDEKNGTSRPLSLRQHRSRQFCEWQIFREHWISLPWSWPCVGYITFFVKILLSANVQDNMVHP